MEQISVFKYYRPYHAGMPNIKAIEEGEIYLQTPVNFNDPFDCRFLDAYVPNDIEIVKRIHSAMTLRLSAQRREEKWQHLISQGVRQARRELTKTFLRAVDKQRNQIGIFSLSFIPDHELLWSHYADSHRGYVVHFQLNRGSQHEVDPKLTFLPVEYITERRSPTMISYFDDPYSYGRELVTNKSAAWSYECEFRMFHPTKAGFMKIPRSWIKSIILGLNVDSTVEKTLRAAASGRKIKIYKAALERATYKIVIPNFPHNTFSGERVYQRVRRMIEW